MRRILAGLGLMTLLISAHLAVAVAASANISRSFQATSNITNGSLVSLVAGRKDYIELANIANGSRLVGVAVNSSDSLLAIDATSNTTQVATAGETDILVSTFNGDIKAGDQVAVSPFNGVGMKATPGSRMIGLAQTAFSANSSSAEKRGVTDKSGHKQEITVGSIRLTIAIGNTSNLNDSKYQTGLARVAQIIAGHSVSTIRIILSTLIAFVALVSIVTLIYAAIYSSIISIGRNPLAKAAVYRTLVSVMLGAFSIAILAIGAIFLFLR